MKLPSSAPAPAIALFLAAAGCASRPSPSARTPPARDAHGCVDASAIEWLPNKVGESPTAGACAELLASASGVYVVERLSLPEQGVRVTLMGDTAAFLTLNHVTSVRAAAEPGRPELLLTGRYTQKPALLPADSPTSGFFVMALDVRRGLLWSLTMPLTPADPEGDTVSGALLAPDGSAVVTGDASVLVRLPGVSAPAAGWVMARLRDARVTDFASFVGAPLVELSSAAPDALYCAEQEGELRTLSLFSASFRREWRRPLHSFSLQALAATASGVWLASEDFVANPARNHLDARVTSFASDGTAGSSFTFADVAAAPLGQQRIRRLALDTRNNVWALGAFDTSIAIEGCRLQSTGHELTSFVAAVAAPGRPRLLARIGTQSTELLPQLALSNDIAIVARDDGSGQCELGRIDLAQGRKP